MSAVWKAEMNFRIVCLKVAMADSSSMELSYWDSRSPGSRTGFISSTMLSVLTLGAGC